MITYTTKTDTKTGEVTYRYLLTQGDSFRFRAIVGGGDDTDTQKLVAGIKFKVSSADWCQIYEADYVQDTETAGTWYCFVPSEETAKWAVSEDYDYRTEIEVTYSDGGVDTVEKGVLKVAEQIKEC